MSSEDSGNNIFEDALNVSSNVVTFGTVGFGNGGFTPEEGKSKNLFFKPIEKQVKNVTGATAAEEANKEARERFNQEKADALAQRGADQQQFNKEQVAASRLAGNTKNKTSRSSTGGSNASLGSDERDFLGL